MAYSFSRLSMFPFGELESLTQIYRVGAGVFVAALAANHAWRDSIVAARQPCN